MRLLRYPDARLRRRAEPLPSSAFGTPGIERYCRVLGELLGATEGTDCLAATHVDLDPPWRVLALRVPSPRPGKPWGVTVLCNPEVVSHADEVVEFETCLPFWCVPVRVAAPRALTVRYRVPGGGNREVECDPVGSRAVWQGCEALDGRLVTDRLTLREKLAFVARYRRKLSGDVEVGVS